ncbi:MAG: hypothetical protein HQL51_09590 [Magnetococcales bacterium]|nr:hypothetical protein [Magnetococcales bacterium]
MPTRDTPADLPPVSPFSPGERGRLAWGALLFLLAFVACASGIRTRALQGLPWSALGGLGDKLALLERQKERIDLIFLGTSRINQGVDPAVFDLALAEGGLPGVRSFNLGVEHLNPVEALWTLERIAEMKPPRLRWIVTELPVSRYQALWENRHALRYRALITLDALPRYLEDIRRQPILLRHRLVDGALFAAAVVYDRSAIGLLSRRLFPLASEALELNRPMPRQEELGQGFYYDYMAGRLPPAGMAPEKAETWAAQAVAQIDTWKAAYAPRNGRGHFARLRPLLEGIREKGYQPVLISVPSVVSYAISQPVTEETRRALPDVPVFDFNDPRRYPAFYQGKHLFGASHLNAAGAALFSRLLAESLRPLLTPTPPPVHD